MEIRDASLLFENRCYNSSANRIYYACFHGAIALLAQEGFTKERHPHEWVRNTFFEALVNRKKLIPREIAQAMQYAYALRDIADYSDRHVSQIAAQRLLKQATRLIQSITERMQQ